MHKDNFVEKSKKEFYQNTKCVLNHTSIFMSHNEDSRIVNAIKIVAKCLIQLSYLSNSYQPSSSVKRLVKYGEGHRQRRLQESQHFLVLTRLDFSFLFFFRLQFSLFSNEFKLVKS